MKKASDLISGIMHAVIRREDLSDLPSDAAIRVSNPKPKPKSGYPKSGSVPKARHRKSSSWPRRGRKGFFPTRCKATQKGAIHWVNPPGTGGEARRLKRNIQKKG